MRTIGCNDMAEDPVLLKKTLRLFETVEQSATASAVIFPWAPSPAVVKRIYAGSRLYMILKRIVDERKETGKREDDPLQYLIDLGDDVGTILQVSLSECKRSEVSIADTRHSLLPERSLPGN